MSVQKLISNRGKLGTKQIVDFVVFRCHIADEDCGPFAQFGLSRRDTTTTISKDNRCIQRLHSRPLEQRAQPGRISVERLAERCAVCNPQHGRTRLRCELRGFPNAGAEFAVAVGHRDDWLVQPDEAQADCLKQSGTELQREGVGPDGNLLYVATSGTGGSTSTCPAVPGGP
jgi:hypothetical protein